MLRKTIVLLVLLRLAIGWHFFFEGWHKLHSYFVGPTETSRPFSGEGYFRGSSGPLAAGVRYELGDLDEQALERFALQAIPADKNPEDVPAAERLPPVLAREIDDYTNRFLESFRLDDAERKQAETKAAAAKVQIVEFLTSSVAEGQYLAEYRAKLHELRRLSDEKLMTLGRDQDNARLVRLKADVARARKDALDELDKEIGKVLRDELAGILKKKLGGEKLASVPKGEDPFTFLLLKCDGESLPKLYEERWDEYFAAFKATYPLTEAQLKTAETKFNTAKALTAEWLAGKQAMPALVVVGQMALPGPDALGAWLSLLAVRDGLVREAGEEYQQMTRYLNAALTDEQAKGAPPQVKPASTFVRTIDKVTMWALTIIGLCLLIGLFTRTNCVLAAGFLALTYLLYPPFPWLPAPPNNEGTYLFVNKNVVEMLALLVLATTASGRWLGLDAFLHRLFHRERLMRRPVRAPARAA
jgi:uncharacterized membrane protein YphA (DoxX/SURF4 family)